MLDGFLLGSLQIASKFLNLGRNHMKYINNFFQFTVSQALLVIQNILQNSDIFNRSQKTVLFTPFGDKQSDTQFSGFLPISVSYLRIMSMHSKDVHTEINKDQMLSCVVILAQAYV